MVGNFLFFFTNPIIYKNQNIESLPRRGPHSGYVLANGTRGEITIEFGEHTLPGIACDRTSPCFSALCSAVEQVIGKSEPYSIGGSLPLVGEMKESGFDIQLIGFGLSSVYHADNEYCTLSDMTNAVKILTKVIAQLE